MPAWNKREFTENGVTEYPPGPGLSRLQPKTSHDAGAFRKSPSGSPSSIYSRWAGTNQIAASRRDQHGNAEGSQYDLIDDGALTGASILVLNQCHIDLSRPSGALARKGFTLIEARASDAASLRQQLKDASQLWIISTSVPCLRSDALRVIEGFFHAGHGLYIWGDNAPLFADANVLLKRLFSTCMSGNFPGDRVVSVRDHGKQAGLVPGHLITTGLVNVFEGSSIAEVHTTKALTPLIYGSNGRVVTSVYDQNGERAIVDGGFTRLFCGWESAGTDRYIVNAAAWLLNIERFTDRPFRAISTNPMGGL